MGGASSKKKNQRGVLFGYSQRLYIDDLPQICSSEPCVDRYIMLSNNPSRPERVAVHLSNESFIYLGRRGFLGRKRPSRAEERARGEQLYVDRYTINLTIIHLGQSAQPYTSHESFIQLRKRLFLGQRRASQAEERARPRSEGNFSGRE